MNGLILAAGVLTATCGAGPEKSGQAYLPGTGGTVLYVAPGDKLDVQRVTTSTGPVVRLTYGRRSIQAPVIRFCCGGSLCDVWVTGKDYNVTQYPKGQMNPPRPRPGESPEEHLKRLESWLRQHCPARPALHGRSPAARPPPRVDRPVTRAT